MLQVSVSVPEICCVLKTLCISYISNFQNNFHLNIINSNFADINRMVQCVLQIQDVKTSGINQT